MDLSTITWNFSTKVEFFRPFFFYLPERFYIVEQTFKIIYPR
ncbi:hypothetical protein CLV42_114151 [Chitinophaga ginsengisoli]|uniref:Uncharacterized protein n=1 Tax=Chitinophaga ginsengisoli TaxID=363837 RepID=A0A2P8FTF6_9BACT|nr:hypothetical protein CLV42_114151 [Chitinophaga ginsengisoli]